MTSNAAPLTSFDSDATLLEEAIGALRISGRIVQRLAAEIGEYSMNNGPPLTASQVVAHAWDTGRMDGFEE